MQTLVPVPMSSKLALSMLQQCTAESEEKSVVESMLEVVESLLALLRSLLAVGERLVAPSFGIAEIRALRWASIARINTVLY